MRRPAPASYAPSALAVCLALLVALPVHAQPVHAQNDASPARFLSWTYRDAARLTRAVDWRTGLYAVGGAALLAPIVPLDAAIQSEVKTFYGAHRGAAGLLDLTNELGGPKATLPVVGLFAVSLATDDTRFQDAAFTSLQSLLYAGTISYGLKYTVGRLRPVERRGAYQFSPFSGNTSFPSGHTVTAFAIVTPWVLYYPHPVTYALFALPVGTAAARLAREKHFATDVLAGGALGVLTGYWLTRLHQDRSQHVSVTPSVGPDALALRLEVRF